MTRRIRSNAGPSPVEIETYDSGGSGQAVVLVHGWPLSGHSWRAQKAALEQAGYRVVAIDRRGFGASDKPDGGYDYDTMAGDVHAVVRELGLDHPVLVGFSMGGGEVARYVGRFGTVNLRGVVFIAAVPPFLLVTDDNPDGGLEDDDIAQMKKGLADDREGFFASFSRKFYTVDSKLTVDDATVANWRELAAPCSTDAALACIDAFSRTDFRADLERIDLPCLVVHGGSDEIVPLAVSGQRTAKMVTDAELHVIEGGPHGILDSHTSQVNELLLDFLRRITG